MKTFSPLLSSIGWFISAFAILGSIVAVGGSAWFALGELAAGKFLLAVGTFVTGLAVTGLVGCIVLAIGMYLAVAFDDGWSEGEPR